jgi:hypothetical protein
VNVPSKWKAFIMVAAIALMAPAATSYAQCSFTCPTADDASIQSMISAAAASGGGVVQLEPRVYNTCKPIMVPSNVHLRGAGRGATIIRGSAAVTAQTVQNSYVAASIATVASNNVTVSDLTVDHLTCQRHANGIAFLPAGTSSTNTEAYDGTACTNGLVERVEVLGRPGVHSYMIWNMRGKQIKFLHNWVDGGTQSTQSPQEGIESYGGRDVLIAGNTVKNIGGACLNVGSAGGYDTGTTGITLSGNDLTNCQVGVNLGTAVSSSNVPQNQTSVRVLGNRITGARSAGIDVAVMPGTEERDLVIANNTIRDMSGSGVIGIWFRANGGTLASSAVKSNTVIGNHFENISGANAHGVRIWSYYNVRVLENTMTAMEGANAGVYIVDSSDVDVTDNRFENTGYSAVQVWGVNVPAQRLVIDRNRVHWAGASAGIFLSGAKYATVKDNVFSRPDTVLAGAVTVASSCSVTVTGNVPWHHPAWTPPAYTACP